MYTPDDVNAFFIDGPLAASSDPVVSPHDQPETYADLHNCVPIVRLLEPDKISRDTQKAARTRAMQRPVTVSVRLVPTLTFWTIMGNSELHLSVLPSVQLDERPQQAVYARGEFALMRAVLADAIYCYQRPFLTKNWRADQLAKEAAAWFADNDEHWPFSFLNICRALALEPDYLRRGLKRWRQGVTSITLDEPQRPATPARRPIRPAA